MQHWVSSEIIRHSQQGEETIQDKIVTEAPLQIMLQLPGQLPQAISITMRTPGDDAALAAGFLYGEGIIKPGAGLTAVQQNEDTILLKTDQPASLDQSVSRNFYMTSSCGVCGKASIEALKLHREPISDSPVLEATLIEFFYRQMVTEHSAYTLTGGCHSAGVFGFDGSVRAISEDVGRHNAVDKCAGRILLSGGDFSQPAVLCLSGRSCYELIQKGVMMHCSVIVSVGAPSSLAVETATEMGVTLVGFYKPGRFNIYSHPERLTGMPG